ncbi:MAG: hypothetical protein GY795_12600 [Desulfobacterales bacterium]|nr:hypothetical protein [Desulfobacterales bacterium]
MEVGLNHTQYSEVTEWLESRDNTMYVTGLTANSRMLKEDGEGLVLAYSESHNTKTYRLIFIESKFS